MSINGAIGALGLGDWWSNELTDQDRTDILHGYTPFGLSIGSSLGSDLIEGNVVLEQGKGDFLACLAGWFEKDNPDLTQKILMKAESVANISSSAKEMHFTYQALIQFYYKRRSVDKYSYNKAIFYCEKQIEVSKKALFEIKKLINSDDDFAPSHLGFKQLSIIYEKEKRYIDALGLVLKAEKDGWHGDWNERAERLQKKINRNQ
jgi:hypothetical protein